MPSYVSKDGVFHAQNEKVALTNLSGKPFTNPKTKEVIGVGEPYIYDGPCRAALFELWEADKSGKTTTFGVDFRKSPEFLQMLRDLNFKTADEYLAWVGYDKEQVEKDFAANVSVIAKHELPKRVNEIKMLGGGKDYATGKNNQMGGFGDPAGL